MNTRPRLYLGVDAGNSKTVAVIADATGTVRGCGRSGNGDIYGAATEAEAVDHVFSAIGTALEMAGAEATWLTHAAFCLAGVDWDSDMTFWRETIHRRLPGLSFCLRNDGFALLRAGAPEGIGVALSSGTGGAVVARSPTSEWSASFWIVDPLGGTALGERAFAAVVRAELGIGAGTRLTDLLLVRHGYPDVATMLEAATRRGAPRLPHAALARDVLDAAHDGDQVAVDIVAEQASALARYATAAATQVGLDNSHFPIVLGGSVMSSSNPALRKATTRNLAGLLPNSSVLTAPRSPVIGAVAEALAESSGPLPTTIMDRLDGYRFPKDFLIT